ncbi:radical SAM protein [Phosphitispora fastidiosa]|uniref:radical SAM protein n=1 Tax=Phosphitispora fastidiosa TaxID=2837202 RepID=UPI001E4A8C30|nr:radical SAM protein [Phosphitispora fastidiosa]MBU7007237.1 radical SAM protein with 4Fe4S-binding SPASM domain [Phosphitispora fastidiosa]
MSAEIKKNNNELAQKWEKSEITLAGYAAQRHVPLGGTFELTPRCNLSCKMCYVRLDNRQMEQIGRERTAAEWIALAKEAVKAGTLNLLVTGGEPLLREDFAEIYTALTMMGFVITLNTNATLITPEILKLFKKYPPTATNVTLYGAGPQTYQSVCGNPEAFDATVRGLEMLTEVATALEVRTTFIRDNMHELDALRAIANRYTKRFGINVTVNKAVRGACSDVEGCRLTPAQMFDLDEANAAYYRALNSDTEAALERNMETDNFVQVKEYGFDLPPKIITCLAAKSMYWITWDGKMLPCGSFVTPFTLPFEEGFRQAWDRLPTLFEDILLPEECQKCEYANGRCANCPAILQTETGSFHRISPYICEVAKERAKRSEKYSRIL